MERGDLSAPDRGNATRLGSLLRCWGVCITVDPRKLLANQCRRTESETDRTYRPCLFRFTPDRIREPEATG